MANHKKKEEEKQKNVACHMTDELNAGLFSVANDYGLTRNEVVRIACNYLIEKLSKNIAKDFIKEIISELKDDLVYAQSRIEYFENVKNEIDAL